MKYNSIGEQLIAKAQELDPNYKPDKFNDMSEALDVILNNSGGHKTKKYNSIGEQLIAKAQELDPNYKPDKFNDMSEAIDVILNNSGSKNEPLEVTENGTYEAPKGTGYSPVKVNVKLENPLQYVINNREGNGVPSCRNLFFEYKGTNFGNALDGLDFSKVKSMEGMFSTCINLTTIPQIDTSNITATSNMFYNCYNLTSIPKLDTSKVIAIAGMFYNCRNLTSIPELDTSKTTDLTNIFYGCSKLTHIGIYGFTHYVDISPTSLEHDALVAFLNQAGTAYNSSQKIKMGSAKLALLSDEEKAIATNKGWTLA